VPFNTVETAKNMLIYFQLRNESFQLVLEKERKKRPELTKSYFIRENGTLDRLYLPQVNIYFSLIQ